MMTVNQLKMQNLAPRGIRATCVPTSICFVTGVCYQDVEYLLMKEQPNTYRPDIQGNRGVRTEKFLGRKRVVFGHKFECVISFPDTITLAGFLRRHTLGTYLVCKRGHAFVVKDGEVFDLGNYDYSDTLFFAWKVEKVS